MCVSHCGERESVYTLWGLVVAGPFTVNHDVFEFEGL